MQDPDVPAVDTSDVRLETEPLRAALGIDEAVLADVRAAGLVLAPRVHDMIQDFYAWLNGFPEFDRFFSDRRLLGHVKSQQVRYWHEFLAGIVDERYVESRRIVGHTHAEIGLGLLVYLRAMQFVSRWFVLQIEAEPTLPATAARSIKALVDFDSAVVVDTYASRTERLLAQQRQRLSRVARVMMSVSEGDLSHRLDISGPDDVLGDSVNRMVESLANVGKQMDRIAAGDYSTNVVARSERDAIGLALTKMTDALRAAADAGDKHVWMARGQTAVQAAMSGNPTAVELTGRVLTALCPVLGAQVGAAYVLEQDELRLAGTYGLSRDELRARWALGEGLVGQVAKDRARMVVPDIPAGRFDVPFGLGAIPPRDIVLVPLLHADTVRGVLELGSLSVFSPRHLDLLESVGPSVALGIEAAQIRARVQRLLEESQAQAEELQAQEEELRQANEELEEQTQLLEQERETAEARNRALDAARAALEQKAGELEITSRYKSDFLANMSHELRTPLNSLLILAKLLSDNEAGNLSEKQVEFAKTIRAAGTELLELINDILDLAKIESGKTSLEITDLPLADLSRYLSRSFEAIAQDRGVGFAVNVDAGAPALIRTDVQRLQQILKNLLSNAFKFTHEGEVRVEIGVDGGQVLFTVRDTGIGIPEDKLTAIFEAFRQVESGTGRRYGGTGLGLTISENLARLLGGGLSVKSTVGMGSAFTLRLPVEAPRTAERPGTSPPALPGPPPASDPEVPAVLPAPVIADDRDDVLPSDRTLLIIEDDLDFARILVDLAHERGFKVVVSDTGAGGLALAQRTRPDAVMLDIKLPDMTGWSVLDRLKRDPATRHVPVHIVTVDEQRKRGVLQGAMTYLRKPVELDLLRQTFDHIQSFGQRPLRRLLLIEDDDTERKALSELLGGRDVEIVAVGSGREALERLDEHAFDCVVLDLGLPDMDGFTVIDRIQEEPARRNLPIIVYTGRELTKDEELRLDRATDAIVIKDVRSPERLLAETALFLHRVEHDLPEAKRRMIRQVRDRDRALAGKKVLVVDDDMRNVFALGTVLEERGMEVVFAENGQDAVDVVKTTDDLDLVLMDVMMPGMDGYEATRAIRKLPGRRSLPIIAVTAKAMRGDREKCLEAGASDYVSKPIDTDQLVSLLRVWLYEPERVV